MRIFAYVQYFCKQLQTVITKDIDQWDTIAIVIKLYILKKDLEIKITSFMKTDDKIIS